ncbi:MAG: hypothetical protein AAGA44_15475 [Pseudomonadota bacterium]
MRRLHWWLLASLCLAFPASANDSMSSILSASVGEWAGQLYYLDYQSGERFGIPMTVSASMTPDGATLKRDLTFTDPGVLVYAVNLTAVDRDTGELVEAYFREGRGELLRYDIVDATFEGPGRWRLVYEQDGIDDGRPARIRHTIERRGSSMDSKKEVRFADSNGGFFLRNGSELALTDAD